MSSPKGYVDPEYLQVVGDVLNQIKQRTYDRMQIQAGHQVLDVGCGPGTDTIPLAHLVGSTGRVYGVDHDEAMIVEADQRVEKAGVSAWVQHKQARAASLPFTSEYFDSCRSERLFQHLRDPAPVLAEMTRVTKTGGWVVVLDTDWGTYAIDTAEIDVERRLNRFFAEQMFYNGYAGRQLYRLLKRQGLQQVSFEIWPVALTHYALARQIQLADRLEQEALAANILTEEELGRWRTSLEQADAEGLFFSYGCLVLAAGRKSAC
ncbi:MAG TPA: methyltransferase domain-containing protein [Candidatus Binatia bacterium]|nr:methyltransferase domain-containing protein [Candidatus Binatia bacterium]